MSNTDHELRVTRRSALASLGLLALAPNLVAPPARAAQRTIRIGVLTDLSSVYAEDAGPGSVLATRMAAEDFMSRHPDIKVEVLVGDMLNKPDVGTEIARSWYDTKDVDAISDVGQSAVALAVSTLTEEKNKVALFGGPGTAELTGRRCSPNQVHWTYDTWANAAAITRSIIARGGDSWFFITADYAFGHALEDSATDFITRAGGKVLGQARFPSPGTTDFSSYLLQAQASGAKVIGLALGGLDVVNCVKQATEFGIEAGGQMLAGLSVQIPTVHALTLATAQGLLLVEAFYWDLNDGTRAFSKRFASQMEGRMPTMVQAGAYSDAMHYLKAVAALGVDEAKKSGRLVVEQMKRMPVEDPLFANASIRADGRVIHDMYVFQVKAPAQSKGPWDDYSLLATIPAADAFRPIAEGGCPYLKT